MTSKNFARSKEVMAVGEIKLRGRILVVEHVGSQAEFVLYIRQKVGFWLKAFEKGTIKNSDREISVASVHCHHHHLPKAIWKETLSAFKGWSSKNPHLGISGQVGGIGHRCACICGVWVFTTLQLQLLFTDVCRASRTVPTKRESLRLPPSDAHWLQFVWDWWWCSACRLVTWSCRS